MVNNRAFFYIGSVHPQSDRERIKPSKVANADANSVVARQFHSFAAVATRHALVRAVFVILEIQMSNASCKRRFVRAFPPLVKRTAAKRRAQREARMAEAAAAELAAGASAAPPAENASG